MTRPLVSIVIPCHNAERWITSAIDSALAQSFDRCEVIVIDDGSKDRSVELIKQYTGRIRYELGPNQGACAARNRGLALAGGDWIQFLDADDMLTPTCVADKLEYTLTTDARTIVCSAIAMMVEPNGTSQKHSFWEMVEYDSLTMLKSGSPQTAAPLHRSETLRSVGGFREHLPCAQEYDLHLRLAIAHDITFKVIDKTGVLIRPVADSLSRAAGKQAKMDRIIAEVLDHAAGLLQAKHGTIPPAAAAAIAHHQTRIAKRMWRRGYKEPAEALAYKARRLSPHWFRHCYANPAMDRLASIIGFSTMERANSFFAPRSTKTVKTST